MRDPVSVRDALGRAVELVRPARRVVSLVPSETESLVGLGGPGPLVGRTEFCVEPARELRSIPTVGGTKSVDVGSVIALAPDLVLANKEENTRSAVEALIGGGLTVHVSFPCTAAESLSYLRTLCALLGLDPGRSELVGRTERALRSAGDGPKESPVSVFVPVWRDPWMTFDARSYAHDLLRLAGARNVFADRVRAYPLAADLGAAAPRPAGDRDTRYPRVSEAEIVACAPELVLLPDEPYAFGAADREALKGLAIPAAQHDRIQLVSGRDLFWYGARFSVAIERLRETIACAKARQSVHTP